MNRESIENIINNKKDDSTVGAIVLHHTLGFIPDTASIAELGIPVIEDISQSYGKTDDKKDETVSGSRGVFCILGLEERDMLTAGGGALIFAMNKKDGALLRNFTGIADEYCLPDINAALAVVQFRELQKNIERRNEIVKIYANASLRTRHKRFIPPAEEENNCFSFSLVLETGLKDVIAYARKKEILLENAFEKTVAPSGLCENCNVSNSLALRTVLFPMYPGLRRTDVERVSRLIMTLP
jgi:dTDP-4-amino-4,6-dideoxygalactose transaminase